MEQVWCQAMGMLIMAGLEALIQAGMVSNWGVGGSRRIHSAGRERGISLSRLNSGVGVGGGKHI